MKQNVTIFLLLAIVSGFLLSNCNKVETYKVPEITETSVEPYSSSARFTCMVNFLGEKEIVLVLGQLADLSDAKRYSMTQQSDYVYFVLVEKLQELTNYYYRIEVSNSNFSIQTELLQFTTLADVPEVTTKDAVEIAQTSAVCEGEVLSEGGFPVTERGICWSTRENPVVSDNHVSSGTGLGDYAINMLDLDPGNTYFVRAYAINSVGIGYGNQISFTTIANLVEIETGYIRMTQSSVEIYGDIENNGGGTVIERGACWNTSHEPTINDSHIAGDLGTGMGMFCVTITGLMVGTTYYVRSYAVNSAGVAYGEEICFTIMPAQTLQNGTLPGVFSVGENKTVQFSQGNLFYIGSANSPYWKFADHQWDFIGESQAVDSHNVDRDLFGWGTSGFPHGAVCYQPWNVMSINSADFYAYGSSTCNLFDQTGKADWGYNAISNGGNITGRWRTLTRNEWRYLLKERTTLSGIRFVKAMVNGVRGVVVLPDDWNNSLFTLNNPNIPWSDYSVNTIGGMDWYYVFQEVGAAFLPSAGYGCPLTTCNVGFVGRYWSASYKDDDHALTVSFQHNDLHIDDQFGYYRFQWGSVRLVRDVE